MTFSFLLSHAGGIKWTIAPCRDAGPEVTAWVEEFASHMGLERFPAQSGRSLRFGSLEAGGEQDGCPRFKPGLPGEFPRRGWRNWGLAGLVFFEHPETPDLFCGIMPGNRPLVLRQFRHALLPVFNEVIRAGGLVVHGALLERDGAGVILLGKSGAGKTTCCRRLPSGWRVLGDDLALVVIDQDGRYVAHPLPTWSVVGSGAEGWPCRAGESVRLEALFVLAQSATDDVESLGGAAAAAFVNESADEALMPLEIYRRRRGLMDRRDIFLNAVALVGAVPSFRLRASLTGRFWETIEGVLEHVETRDREAEKFFRHTKVECRPR